MSQAYETLPPLEWVRVFEAAARRGSFTAAAEELGLTQAAVSQRIRNLERRLGAQLFDRRARGVSLSTRGEAWLPPVQAALGELSRSTSNLFAAPRHKITVAASSSVIALWIAPRLPDVHRALPRVQLSFETIQRLPDYSQSEADLEIRFGDGRWQDMKAVRLYAEELAPVAAPELLKGSSNDWEGLPLIAVSGPRLGWRDWALATNSRLHPTPVLRFDTFVEGLAAAKAGAGILLASLPLTQATLDAGELVRLSPDSLHMETGYWLTWSAARPPFRELETLVEILAAPTNSPSRAQRGIS